MKYNDNFINNLIFFTDFFFACYLEDINCYKHINSKTFCLIDLFFIRSFLDC
jgi:hypothetical protein